MCSGLNSPGETLSETGAVQALPASVQRLQALSRIPVTLWLAGAESVSVPAPTACTVVP